MDNVKKNRYMGKRLVWHKKEVEEVIDLILHCKKREEVENIFDKILTPREINDIARRYKVLKMIDTGSSYSDIITETGMSSVTVARISMQCGYGFQKSLKTETKPKRKIVKKSGTMNYKGVKVRSISR